MSGLHFKTKGLTNDSLVSVIISFKLNGGCELHVRKKKHQIKFYVKRVRSLLSIQTNCVVLSPEFLQHLLFHYHCHCHSHCFSVFVQCLPMILLFFLLSNCIVFADVVVVVVFRVRIIRGLSLAMAFTYDNNFQEHSSFKR